MALVRRTSSASFMNKKPSLTKKSSMPSTHRSMLAKMSSQDEDDDKKEANTIPEKQPQKSDEKSSIFNKVRF